MAFSEKLKTYTLNFLKWAALATLTGLAVGLAGSLFGLALHWVTHIREANPWLLWLLPAGGVVIVFLYQRAKLPDGSTNAVFTAVREKELMPLRTAPVIFVSTALTHLLGGSAGREGAALQLGGSLADSLARLLRLDSNSCRIMTMCGMSAAFAALFGTPLAAAVFALEVVSVGMMYYAALFPCLLSALLGAWLSGSLGLSHSSFILTETVALSPLSLLQATALGILTAMLSMFFCFIMHQTHHLCEKYFKNPYLRVVAGGLAVIALTLLVNTGDYNGAGEDVLAAAVGGTALPLAFLLKPVFTAVTLGSGYRGGEIVPALFCGATFGCVAAPLLGLPAPLGAALGMVALFCGVTNSPLASILLAVELFGGASIALFALTCGVSYMLSGYFSLYSGQKIIYSKLRAEFVDRDTH